MRRGFRRGEGSQAGCTSVVVRSSPPSRSCEDVGIGSSVSTGAFSILPLSALQPALFMGHSRGSSTLFQPLRPWHCCARCETLILLCRLATIARSWVTLREEEVEMAHRQNHRWPICGGKIGLSSISRAGKGQFSMFKLKSHIPFDSSWTPERKRDWFGNEVADLAAKRALEAWRGDAEFADQYCGWVKFASAWLRTWPSHSRIACRTFHREPVSCRLRGQLPCHSRHVVILHFHGWSLLRLTTLTPCGSQKIL